MRIRSEIANALIGAIVALFSSYFVALSFAYTLRIPIPMAGYYGPLGEFSTYALTVVDVLKMILVAWVFYGIFGGFFILLALGAVAGVVAGRKNIGSKRRIGKVSLYSVLAGAIPVLALSVLDYVIGPW